MTDTFTIKRDDLEPAITATLRDAAGDVVDLTSAVSVHLVLKPLGGGSAVRLASTILDAAGGRVRHTWVGAETATADTYAAEWEILWPSSRKQSFPTIGTFFVTIAADQG